MIDVNLQTDLANKKERDKIRDAKDKVGDVVKTVENVIDSDNVGGLKENYVNNRFATRGANAVEDDPKLSKLLNELKAGKLSEDEAKDVIIATIQKMYLANGFSEPPNIKFEKEVSGKTDGARGTETGTIYLDIEKIKASMDDKDNGGTSVLIGLIAHESSHSEKYGETSGNLLIEEGFANSKEELARDKFKETDKTLSEKEKKEALAEIKKDVATERAISDSLTVNSKDEPVENQNATEYGDKKKTLLEKTKDYAVEKGNEFVLHLKETDWLDTINRSLDYPKGLLLGAGESATFGYTNFIEDHISIYDKETYYFGKFSGNYLVGSILSEGGKAGGITLTLSGAGSVVGVSVFSYSEAVQLYSVGAIASNSVLMVNSGGDEGKNNVSDYNTWNKGTFNSSKETINYHFKKHGKEVGAESVEQYMKKAEAFKNNLKGAKKSDVKGKVKGVIRYKKNGKYIDIAPDGSIISFGKQ